MSIQIDKVSVKIFRRSWAFALVLLTGAVALFIAKQKAPEPMAVKPVDRRIEARTPAEEITKADSNLNGLADKVKEIPANYYDHLPLFETVVAEVKSLDAAEIDEKIKEIDQDLANSELIEKANAHTLDEAGYRLLAQLMQMSDALYNVKIERQLASLEADLGIRKSGT